tara:strand:+ start:325 stop:453 length:129 start_codon:yes stop_codon:yes gene_type:complete
MSAMNTVITGIFHTIKGWPYERIFASYSTDALWGPGTQEHLQ